MATKKEELSAEMTIKKLAEVLEKANKAAGVNIAETGACLISLPGNPRPTCAMMTPSQCNDIHGAYIGGNCS